MSQDGHAFRGEYLELCARVEAWAAAIFASNTAVESGLLRRRTPHLFGQKLKAISELTEAASPIFCKPQRVAELMAKFQPYAELRSELAHATMTASNTIIAFNNCNNPDLPLNRRFWLTPEEARKLLTNLKQLAKEICDQRVKD